MIPVTHHNASQSGVIVMYPEHKGQAVYILSVVSACTTFLVLLLRFWSRSLHASGFRSDDWTAAAAERETAVSKTERVAETDQGDGDYPQGR